MSSGNARAFFSQRVDAARGRVLVNVSRTGSIGATGDGPLLELKLKPLGPAPRNAVEVIGISPVGAGNRALSAASGAKHQFDAKAQ